MRGPRSRPRGAPSPSCASPISADAGDGLDALRALLAEVLPDAAGLAAEPEPTGVVVHRLDAAGEGFTLEREGDAFRVRGKRIERIAVQTNFEVEESAERFQRDLDRLGIDGALRRAGVQPGDTVRIGRVEFEWGASAWDEDGAVTAPAGAGPIGILGGTFDPPHLAHLAIAEEAREVLGLSRVLFVPAGQPWQKADRPCPPGPVRLAMVERAIAGNPFFVADPREVNRPGPSYTAETVAELAAETGARAVVHPLGRGARGLRNLARPGADPGPCAALRRAPRRRAGRRARGVPRALPRGRGPDRPSSITPGSPSPSTAIRARVRAGRSIRYLVPDAVAALIAEYALYTADPVPVPAPADV